MIKTFTGPMHSGKTAAMIVVYNRIWNKDVIRCFKPNKDTRDYGVIKSKDIAESIPCICIDTFEEIFDHIDEGVTTIFIDEAELLEGDVRVLSYLSIMLDMDIYCAGLSATSELDPFLAMPSILAISDEIVAVKASCQQCGREASHTYFDGQKTDTVLVGNEGYISLCDDCLRKAEERNPKLFDDAFRLRLTFKNNTGAKKGTRYVPSRGKGQ